MRQPARLLAALVGMTVTATVLVASPALAEEEGTATMLLEGTVVQVAVEYGNDPEHVDAPGEDEHGDYVYAIATEDHGFVPVDGALLEGAASGSSFSGVVEIPAEVAPAGSAGEPIATDTDVIEAAGGLGYEFTVAEASIGTAPVEPALGSYLSHSVYLAIVTTSGGFTNSYTDTQATNLVTTARNYWVAQSEGAIPSFTQTGTIQRYNSTVNCTTSNYTAFWNEAIGKFGVSSTFFVNNGAARHLVVLLPIGCQDYNHFGWGTIGSQGVDSGGVLEISSGNTADTQVLAHEIGHNLSLNHANLSYCPSACSSVEYADVYDIMGVSFTDVAPIPALNSISKLKLGFIADSKVTSLSLPGDVATQTTTITLKPINDRAATGIRIIKVTDPASGVVRYIEYRSGTADDAGSVYAAGPRNITYGGATMRIGPGVRLLRSDDATGKSLLASWWNTGVSPNRAETSTTAGGSISLTSVVVGMTGGSAAAGATVNVTLTRATGNSTISGNVKNRAGSTNLAGICVDAIRNGIAYASATTNASGNYTISGVPVGTGYILHFSDCPAGGVAYEDRWWSDGDTYVQATAFDVTASQTITGRNATLFTVSPFADVRNSHPFYTEIKWMFTSGLSTGTTVGSDKYYYPASAVSRGAMAAFLYREAGSPAYTPPTVASFTDVPVGASFFKEIEWMKFTGITTGTPNGNGTFSYKPTDSVSRQSMSAFLYRLAGSPAYTPPGTPSFTDVPTSAGFYKEVEWMKAKAITTGYAGSGGTFYYNPTAVVNRAAMAAFLNRYDNLP